LCVYHGWNHIIILTNSVLSFGEIACVHPENLKPCKKLPHNLAIDKPFRKGDLLTGLKLPLLLSFYLEICNWNIWCINLIFINLTQLDLNLYNTEHMTKST